ncbi:MAG: HD domain-containing protein [Paludibacteraceae bacterium]|nr:HD domain-containing protein [Paludibacteraceae bacterium]
MNEFQSVAASNSDERLTHRELPIYKREGDVRSDFDRDYTRILHSFGFRRLKHKTQVFFGGAGNDHICTRMEHVTHVGSVAFTLAEALGLNLELVKAIALGHDLGHAPFGHHGEMVLNNITKQYLNESFWHERNGLHFIDDIEILPDHRERMQNLNLTYAVRDGIISHCGEIDESSLKPRTQLIDLNDFKKAGQFQSCTWEGCVVKLSDKIAYLGRDIEDATILGYFSDAQKAELREMSAAFGNGESINTTSIIHNLIFDICRNSSPEKGLCFSPEVYELLCRIKNFNNENIYKNPRLETYRKYSQLIINELFRVLMKYYSGSDTIHFIANRRFDGLDFVREFAEWIAMYCNEGIGDESLLKIPYSNLCNKKIYGNLDTQELYVKAVVDYISGMTDLYAQKSFEELLKC